MLAGEGDVAIPGYYPDTFQGSRKFRSNLNEYSSGWFYLPYYSFCSKLKEARS